MTPIGCREEVVCEWTPWCDDEAGGGKVTNTDEGEFEYIEDCRDQFDFCEEPTDIECEMAGRPHLSTEMTGQNLICDLLVGLECFHSPSQRSMCFDYRIR